MLNMTTSNRSSKQRSGQQSKVATNIEKYDLQEVGDELERLWITEDPDDRMSLRELADRFNQRLLLRALETEGIQTLDGEIENLYRLLTNEMVSGVDRMRTERRLEREGVDVEAVENDFVSYQSIRTYLTKYRDIDYSREVNRLDSAHGTVQRLRSRTNNVTKSKLERLLDSDEITLGDFRVMTDISVLCNDCGTKQDILDILELGGCECD